MKVYRLLTSTVLLFFVQLTFAQTDHIGATVFPSHPRILLFKGEEAAIKKNIAADKIWSNMQQAILDESDNLLALPPVERIQIGRRLLDKSREALRRMFFLSYSYRMTHDKKYLQRGEKEMLAISAFSDWNPTHFLDVAEMTMALAIGYDWLYDDLSPASRSAIKAAILTKGLTPSLDPKYSNNWNKAEHNWNQVCHAGMTYGAMAIYEDQPELAKQIINRAIDNVPYAMKDYGPDGIYPEGYGYWGYGSSFNVMFISAIEKLFGKDFGLSQSPGFLKTGGFLENMTGPFGYPFNYSDSDSGSGLQPAMFWFATKSKDPSILWVERSFLLNKKPSSFTKNRLLPAIMLWNGGLGIEKITAPTYNMWSGAGKNPIAMMRTSWTDSNAIYVAAKGGSVSINHAHMDVGSFVMDADGVRWAMDFGRQEYESLESKGIQLFGRTQDAQRWTVFRYTNLVHNTLTVNNQHQRVTGSAPITATTTTPAFMSAIIDMTEVYKGAVAKANRGIALVDKNYVMVRDEVTATDTITTIRWTLLTPSVVKITGKNTAELTQGGKKLLLQVQEPASVVVKTWSTDPPHDYDAPNPGTAFVGFEITVPAKSTTAITVALIPAKAIGKTIKKIPALANWSGLK
jgi:hypothetical protein